MHTRTMMEKVVHKSMPNMTGIVVMKDGQLEYETYGKGFTRGERSHIFSVTKSIVSLLIGVALDQGHINRLDEKILSYYPEYDFKNDFLKNVTIKDIMSMTVPYKYQKEPYEDYFTSKDWIYYALESIGGTKIGEFRYAPIIGPDLLTGILTKVTGKSVLEFANETLFHPLGIDVSSKIQFTNAKEQLDWYKEKKTSGWVVSPTGIYTAGWGLSLSPLDMAKLGQLCLNQGQWEGRQLISNNWIQEMTTQHSMSDHFTYGYLWWILNEEEHSYAAMGDGGNIIYVNPSKDLVVAIGCYLHKRNPDTLLLIKEYIEPAICKE